LLLDDPSLVPTAVEEMLRWGTPVMYFRRTATRDVELAGQQIGEGDKVTMWHISGNRDETVFSDPYRFDVRRAPNDHIAFGGGGPHFCLGANLARLEIKVMFEELLRRLPDIELDGPVARLRSNFINGIKRMPVVFTAQT
jgi:cytochrome P450